MTQHPVPSQYFRSGTRAKRGATSHLITVRLPEDLVERLAEVGNQEPFRLPWLRYSREGDAGTKVDVGRELFGG
jgi:hypothetical protein